MEQNKIGIFMYEGSPLFEIVIAAYILNTKYNVEIILDKANNMISTEGIGIVQSCDISEVNVQHMDALIICGGYTESICNRLELDKLICKMKHEGKVIAGICAGREIVNEALKMNMTLSKHTELLDGNILLSPPNEYIKFGIEIGRILNVYQDEDDYHETITFFEQGEMMDFTP